VDEDWKGDERLMLRARSRFLVHGVLVGAGALLALVAAGGPVGAQPQLSDQDRQYLVQAHQGNLAEIAAGRLAQTKGASQQVKDIGALLVTDHTRLDTAVQQVSSAAGVQLPATPNAEQQAMQAKLENASPGEFDATFITGQLQAHAKTMRLGQTELDAGSSAEVKKAAADAAPVIQAHHDRLSAAARQLGVPTSINTGSAGLAATPSPRLKVAVLVLAGFTLTGAGVLGLRRRARR
jgi:putative membrane protein